MYLIVTNNPMAAKEFAGQGEVRLYPEDTYREILVRARDLVYIGHRLRNHPLYGSLRPHETPYRTVVLSDRPRLRTGRSASSCRRPSPASIPSRRRIGRRCPSVFWRTIR